jgi:5S rRNA maturation endonuclease (ribonuclease M5)
LAVHLNLLTVVIVEGKNGHKPLETYGLEHPIVVLGAQNRSSNPISTVWLGK